MPESQVRIFVFSPSDVDHERAPAKGISKAQVMVFRLNG